MKTKGKKVRQYRSNQGRSPEQQAGNEWIAIVSWLALCVIVLGVIVYSIAIANINF